MGTTDPVNILMVDDQPGKLLTYGAILGELGENLITATTARDALDTLLRMDIAIVLMDVSMPEIDGFELAAMIRQHPRFQETAIIFVSGVHLTDLDRLKGYEAGAVDYIPVPVVPEILRAKVGTFAELHRKRRQLEELNRELERRVEERTAALEAAAARLRASEERLQVILRNTSAVIYLVGPDDTFLHVNRGFEALFGCHNDEIHGLPLRAVLPPNVAAMYAANHRRVVAEGASVEFEEVIPRLDGARTYTSIQTPLFDEAGRPAGVVGVATDITERKRAEDERAELLRREREARLEAEAATQARDEFVSVAAHELKTPVTGLRTTAQVMARRMTKAGLEIPGWLSDGLRVVDQQSDRLARLIGQLLDLSRLDQDNLLGERTATDLVALAERLVAAARARATQHRLVLTTDASVVVDVDMVSIEQVLSNLLDNAIKYSPDGGQVDVEVGALEDGRARMAVRDRGLGIPPKKREAIFERFYRAHGDDHRSGLGLGLYISQRIVALHGGEIVAEFPPDGGTRFMVLLPTRATARERGRPRAKSAATSRGE